MTNNLYLPQDESTYKALQPFDNVEQMNETIKIHKQSYELSQTDRNILDAISRYACKHAGVTYLSKQKLAEDAGYKSRRTAIRSCRRLEELGIIEQYETRRIKGDRRQSSNIIVIKAVEEVGEVNRKDEQVTADSHSLEAPYKTINSSNTYDSTKRENIAYDTEKLIHDSIRNHTPVELVDMLSPFFYGSELYKYIGIVFKAKYHHRIKIRIEDNTEAFRACISDVIRRFKRGDIASLEGYLFASIKRLTRRIAVGA